LCLGGALCCGSAGQEQERGKHALSQAEVKEERYFFQRKLIIHYRVYCKKDSLPRRGEVREEKIKIAKIFLKILRLIL
ncbi:MAG: hypothetical protein Q7J80_13915, partial [Anaerolineales bacterium]|nr:hypothetical protein [Anaerolineales bacterium]